MMRSRMAVGFALGFSGANFIFCLAREQAVGALLSAVIVCVCLWALSEETE